MAEKREIIFGQVGNALKSVAADHIIAASEDVYDESLQKYQTDLNKLGKVYCLGIIQDGETPSEDGDYLVSDDAGDIVKHIKRNGETVEEVDFSSGIIYISDEKMYSFDGISLKLLGQGGSGGNIINVTEMYPLESGYYTLQTARTAIKENQRGLGRCLSYKVSETKWETKQFLGSSLDEWLEDAKWEDFGGGGTIKKLVVDSKEVVPDEEGVATVNTNAVKQVTFNGEAKLPDEGGNVGINIDIIDVDESLDINSTNPVENKAVTTKINEISDAAVGGVEVLEEDGKNTLNILNKQGNIIATTEFTGGGGGGGTSTASRIMLTASLDKTQVKEGGSVMLTYNYDHLNADNESDGTRADITVTVKRGTTTTYENTTQNVPKGTYTVDISDYLLVGTVDVYVKAACVTEDGSPQSKQVYKQLSVITLDLKSGYSIGLMIPQGGYSDGDTIEIPYSITGSGTKVVSMYLDGGSSPITQTVSKSGTTNGSFLIQASSLSAGRHNVQLVAERDGLLSDSIYMDILKGGSSECFIGVKYYDEDGDIMTGDWTVAKVKTRQFENLTFDIVAYDPSTTPAMVKEYNNGNYIKDLVVGRTPQTYAQRFTEKGTVYLSFVLGTLTYRVNVVVAESKIDVSETTQGLTLKLSASGRSNEEQKPGVWTYGDVTTLFTGFDWKSSGWIDNSLKLINGAAITIDAKPFVSDIAKDGYTFEAEVRVSNILDSDYVVLECMDNNKGFRITSESAGMFTGSSKKVTDDDGVVTEVPIGVETKFASGEWYKIAFMVGKRTDGRLMELFVNGERNRADIYAEADNFNQETPSKIYVRSEKADVEIRNIRMYSRAINDEEEFNNYAIDKDNVEDIFTLLDNNDVLDDETSNVSVDKIINKGHGVMVVVRSGGLDPVNAENNKKTDFLCDYVIIYTPWGDIIEIRNCNIRIQGTSSTKYARKNYRIYAAKGSSPEVWINGVKQSKNVVPVMKDDPFPVKILCPKCDFSDSSMTHNTGTAKLYNEWMKKLDLLTPPQKTDERVRSCIYGYPIDVFSAETIDGERTYYGQYNMNNDKSDWYELTGMTDKANHIALEFLNNTEKLGLFQCDTDLETQFENEFADALEFNYPKDTFWNGADTEGGEVNATEVQKNAILRLWGWVRDCVPSGADKTFTDISTYASPKFKSEISQYFVLNHLLTWYLITDYLLMVDQRVKNMILRTWDLLIWYITYYDGDTMLGLRNDSFLAYLYNASRETWDSEKSKWAFEGHDSVLWALVLANFQDELKLAAKSLRAVMTNDSVLSMYNNEQMDNWCEKLYNKSGKFKYIDPIIDGVNVGGEIKRYPEIYALQGSRKAHRTNFIKKRFALLDGKYETGQYLSDNIDMYMNRTASDAADKISVTSNDLYYYGYGTNNAPSLQPSQKCEKDESVVLSFTRAFTVNDPIRVYGASMMKELDFKNVSGHITGNLNLNKCTVLQRIDFGVESGKTPHKDWFMVLDQCKQLQWVNLYGQTDAKTGTSTSTEINLSAQTKIKYLNAGGTSVNSVVLANGAPIELLNLPSTIKTLTLEYLPNLGSGGLYMEGYENVETFRFAQCPLLNWEEILSKCVNVKRIRVTGIDTSGDGSLLDRYMYAGGVDADGNAVSTCSLVGTYRLTKFIEDDSIVEAWKAHYPELNIINAQYTLVMFDDANDYPQNMTNLENGTSGETYVASGHLLRIRKELIPVTGKLNVSTGIWEGKRMSDTNYQYLYDGSSFDYSGNLGDLNDAMMRMPECYYKGINDFKNQRKYIAWSSFKTEPMPSYTKITRQALSTLLKSEKSGVFTGKAIVGSSTVDDVISTAADFNVYEVDVEGMKQVRFPGLNRIDLGGVFVNSAGTVMSTFNMAVTHGEFDFVIGDYVFTDVPVGAKSFVFTSQNTVDGDTEVIAVDSSEIEAIEPDWVHHEACLGGIYHASVDSLGRLRSLSKATVKRGTGTQITSSEWQYDSDGNPTNVPTSTMNFTGLDFKNLAYTRGKGYQLFDYEMSKFMAILFFSLTGNRNSQLVCGNGSFVTTTGYTDSLGNASSEYGLISSGNKCLGFESFFGCVWEWMDNICVNVSSYEDAKKSHFPSDAPYVKDAVYHIYNPLTGEERKVQGLNKSGYCIARVKHGRYCDVIASALSGDNSSWLNNYCDVYYYNNLSCRFVGRSDHYGGASGGIVYAYAHNASSHSHSLNGSRLAFRGMIKITE